MVRGEWDSLLPLAEPGGVRVAAPDSLVLLALTLGAVASPPPHTAAQTVLCRFLSLAGNRIRRVENLQTLRHLRVLDLSHNQIQTLDPGGRQEWVWTWPGSAREVPWVPEKCRQTLAPGFARASDPQVPTRAPAEPPWGWPACSSMTTEDLCGQV